MDEPLPYLLQAQGFRLSVLRLIGEGGFSRVYECRLEGDDRPLAAKVACVQDKEEAQSILDEMECLGRLPPHPHVVQTLGLRVQSVRKVYLLMQLCEGSVEQVAAQMDEISVVRLMGEMVQALQFLDLNGIVHMDIKPTNILLKSGTHKLADFNLAFKARPGLNQSKQGGSLFYYAPQRLQKYYRPSIASDVFSLGVVLYQLLHDGQHPFIKSRKDLKCAQYIKKLQKASSLSAVCRSKGEFSEFQSIVLRMIQKDPSKRITLDQLIHFVYSSPVIKRANTASRPMLQPSRIPLYQLTTENHASTVLVQTLAQDKASSQTCRQQLGQLVAQLTFQCKTGDSLLLEGQGACNQSLQSMWSAQCIYQCSAQKISELRVLLFKYGHSLSQEQLTYFEDLVARQEKSLKVMIQHSECLLRLRGERVNSCNLVDRWQDRVRYVLQGKLMLLDEVQTDRNRNLLQTCSRLTTLIELLKPTTKSLGLLEQMHRVLAGPYRQLRQWVKMKALILGMGVAESVQMQAGQSQLLEYEVIE